MSDTENVVDKIEHDHREVEQLFDEFEASRDRAIALKICEELEIHTAAEEMAVYPVIAAEAGEEAEIEDAEEEHDEARDLIARIRQSDTDDELAGAGRTAQDRRRASRARGRDRHPAEGAPRDGGERVAGARRGLRRSQRVAVGRRMATKTTKKRTPAKATKKRAGGAKRPRSAPPRRRRPWHPRSEPLDRRRSGSRPA